MGVLDDAPPRRVTVSVGKFMRLYRTMDEDDQALLRQWCADPLFSTSEIHRRLLAAGFDIGRSSVERGLEDLTASERSD